MRTSEPPHSREAATTTAHASAVLIGSRAALIRGPSGSGKSRLAMALIDAAASGLIRFARLVADDRVELVASQGRLLLRPPPALAGLIEIRGVGVRRVAFEPVAVAGLVVDLEAADAERIPASSAQVTDISGIPLPRLPAAAGAEAFAAVLAMLRSEAL
ncbi:MAG: serine kinase [Rhizobiales bacterium]|nr:serine kinase [Hyphomicrobiales bacterium]